jgi:hypothetical protein
MKIPVTLIPALLEESPSFREFATTILSRPKPSSFNPLEGLENGVRHVYDFHGGKIPAIKFLREQSKVESVRDAIIERYGKAYEVYNPGYDPVSQFGDGPKTCALAFSKFVAESILNLR